MGSTRVDVCMQACLHAEQLRRAPHKCALILSVCCSPRDSEYSLSHSRETEGCAMPCAGTSRRLCLCQRCARWATSSLATICRFVRVLHKVAVSQGQSVKGGCLMTPSARGMTVLFERFMHVFVVLGQGSSCSTCAHGNKLADVPASQALPGKLLRSASHC